MDKVVPITFRKRAVCQFKIVTNVRNAQMQVIGQREQTVTKIFTPTTTLHEVMTYVARKSEKIADSCILVFETENPEFEAEETSTEPENEQ